MGFYNSPRIILDDLVLNLDAGNIKSYAGDVAAPAGTSYGYFGGGYGGSPAANLTTVSRIDFDNDTATAVAKGPLSNDGFPKASVGSFSYGYFSGGETSPGSYITSTLRLDYSSDTPTTAVKGPLSAANRRSHAAVGDNSYGYHCAGPALSSVDRIDYSNDTAAASPKGPLSAAKWYLCATGNQSYGYIGGGYYNPGGQNTSIIDRIDYSNDTATAAAKGPLSVGRYNGGATGNASYGWFGGGNPGPKSTIDRLDYSSDTTTAAVKGPLAAARSYVKATGNTSYGYWGGGHPSSTSTVQRVDYSSDTPTASPKGPLSVGAADASGVSSRANANPTTSGTQTRSVTVTVGTPYGYWGGGGPSNTSIIDRLDYDSDTTTMVAKGPLSQGRKYHSATSNTSYGYFAAGYFWPSPAPSLSLVDRLDYSSDTTTAVVKGPLAEDRYYLAATGNNSYGYVGGGDDGAGVQRTWIDRIDYSNDTATAAAKGPLDVGRKQFAATGNTSYGYWAGGTQNGATYFTYVSRLDYSSDTTTAAPKGPLSVLKGYMGATGNASYGYFAGGDAPGVPGEYTLVDRIDYSNDTATAVAKGPLATGIADFGATGNTSYGYFGGAQGPVTTIQRIDYSSDTSTAAAKSLLSSNRQQTRAASPRDYGLPGPSTIYPWYDTSGKGDDGDNSSGGATYGSAGGGSFTFNGSSNYVSSDDKANLQLGSGNFTLAAWIKPGSMGTNYGYFASGKTPSKVSIVQRIDFGNDTATAATKGPLSVAKTFGGGSSSTSYGYQFGGYDPSPAVITTTDRIDYSNDTATAAVKGPLNTAVARNSGVGNADYGYSLGGRTSNDVSTIERIDYSSDTSTASPKGKLSAAKRATGSTGNSSYGYFGGGYGGSPAQKRSSIDRIDYSNDTATAPAKGPLSSVRYSMGGTGNASYGYWAGGAYPNVSTTDRLDYSSDTTTAATKGPLSAVRRFHGATGTNSYGWWGGGNAGPILSSVDRLDFSNDTATAAVKGPFATAVDDMISATCSSKINALPLHNDNEGIISYSDTAGEENDTTCQIHLNNDGKIRFSGAAGIVTSTSALSVDTWAHAAVTRTDNTISVYVNGVLENTGITTHTFSDYAKVTIGANRPRTTFYKGDISQVQIYKKSLSSNEIQQNFRSVKKRFGL